MALAGLPADVTAALHRAILASVNDPQTRSKLEERGITVRTSSPDEFRNYVKAENAKWAEVVKASGAQVD